MQRRDLKLQVQLILIILWQTQVVERQREMLETIYKSQFQITILEETVRFKNKSMDNKKKLSKAIN